MKKSQFAQLRPQSAEFVVAHGLWRKNRGRRPSMSYMGECNPEKALKLAIVMIKDVKYAKEHARLFYRYVINQKAKFEEKMNSLDKKYGKLPEIFQKRIDKLRTNNHDFRWKYESYEMFCCEQAVIIAAAIGKRLFDEVGVEVSFDQVKENIISRAPSAFQKFYDMSWEKQKELVPNLSDGHRGGSSFECSVMLAYLYVSDRLDDIVNLYGASSVRWFRRMQLLNCIART